MTVPHVIVTLYETAQSRAKACGPEDSSGLLALAMGDAVAKLYLAAVQTLEENRHLADGEQCTLLKLRQALE